MSKYSRRPSHFKGHVLGGKPSRFKHEDMKTLEGKKLMREFENMKDFAEMRAYSKLSQERPLTKQEYERYTALGAKHITTLQEAMVSRAEKYSADSEQELRSAHERAQAQDEAKLAKMYPAPKPFTKTEGKEILRIERMREKAFLASVNEKGDVDRVKLAKELKKGIAVEAEHASTIQAIKKEGMSTKEAEERIARDHLKEDPHYYEKLAKVERRPSHHSLRRVTAEPFHKKDTSLRLNIRTAVIVPSTHHGNKPVDKAAYERRVKETERFLAKTYGGYTAVSAHGGYVGERGKLIDEPVTEVVAYTDKKGYAKNRGKVERFLAKKQGQWTQESIGYERDVNAHLYYYKKK